MVLKGYSLKTYIIHVKYVNNDVECCPECFGKGVYFTFALKSSGDAELPAHQGYKACQCLVDNGRQG